MTMLSFRILPIILLAFAHTAYLANAFATNRNLARIHSLIPPQIHAAAPTPQTFLDQRTSRGHHERTSATVNFAKKKGSSNNDDAEKKTEERKPVEDGSPLGVAIVLIGSLIIFNGEDSSHQEPASSSVWIVFATASIAAGLARLVRYLRDKDE